MIRIDVFQSVMRDIACGAFLTRKTPDFLSSMEGLTGMLERPDTSSGAEQCGLCAESECAAVISRVGKNIATIRRTYTANASIHLNPGLQEMIAEVVAKLP